MTSSSPLPERHPNSSPTDQSNILELFDKAQDGDTESQYELGKLYFKGAGLKKDISKAQQWLHAAAAGGHVRAQALLDTISDMGVAESAAPAAPAAPATPAASAAPAKQRSGSRVGVAAAVATIAALGVGVYLGVDWDADGTKAWARSQQESSLSDDDRNILITTAAEKGHADAQFKLGNMYDKGEGVAQN